LIKIAPRRGKNGACFFEKCDSQYEAFGGVPGRVDYNGFNGKQSETQRNSPNDLPKSQKKIGTEDFPGLSRLFPLFTTKTGVK
jgi:hypothetical protein